jgi:hypothetical protein
MYIFEICPKRGFFDAPLDLFKEKSFHLIEGTTELYENLKGQKWKKPLNILINGFLETDLTFSLSFQTFMPHIEIIKFCLNY